MVNGGRSLHLDACPRLPPGRRDLNQRASAVALKWTTRSYNVARVSVAGASAVAPRWQSFKQLTPREHVLRLRASPFSRECALRRRLRGFARMSGCSESGGGDSSCHFSDGKRIHFLCRAVLDSAAYIARASGDHGPLQSLPAHAASKSVAFEMRSLRDKAYSLREEALTVCFGLAHSLIRVT